VESPRFAPYLPSGKLLDWAWEQHSAKRAQFNATPGLEAVKHTWDQLSDDDIANLAAHSDNGDVLEWVAQRGLRRAGVRSALVRNPYLPYDTLLGIVERGTNTVEREGIANTRGSHDLCRLLLAGHVISNNPRQLVTWFVSSACNGHLDGRQLRDALGALDEAHHPLFLTELLRTDHVGNRFPLEPVLDLIEDHAGKELQENSWRSLGMHLAEHGTTREMRRALAMSSSASLRAVLVSVKKIPLGQALARMDTEHRLAVLRQLSTDRHITLEEAPIVANLVTAVSGTTNGSTPWSVHAVRAVLHGLHYEPAAVNWMVANTSPVIAGTVIWHSESDAALISALRRNPLSHQLAAAHIWRVGRVWDRLSTRTRTSIVETFDGVLLSNLAPGSVRDWIVSSGPVSAVSGLLLKKTEQRTLMDRVEKEREPALAWVAAKVAERPRDRVRMAEIGMLGENWETGIRAWVRGTSSSEILKLWAVAGSTHGNELGKILVANLRTSEETSWLDRLVGEIRIEWQSAPAPVQEAAAHWLSGRCGSDPETWSTIWSLYGEWTGTLPELVDAATNV
jgi:hypothetical protein